MELKRSNETSHFSFGLTPQVTFAVDLHIGPSSYPNFQQWHSHLILQILRSLLQPGPASPHHLHINFPEGDCVAFVQGCFVD